MGLWNFIQSRSNRELLTWLGGGAVVIIGGLWALFVYFFPPKQPANATRIQANCGSVAVGRDVSNATIVAGNDSKADCKN